MKVIPQSIDEIIPAQLYLSNLSAARSVETRSQLGITHVLSICPDYSSSDNDFHLTIPVNDTEYDDILINLPSACAFIQSAVDNGGAVLVHCVMGISRSATVVAAYLMKACNMTRQSALAFIKQRRPIIHPNYSFLVQLDVFAQCSYSPSPNNPIYCTWKRSFRRTARQYIDYLNDTTEIVPGQILLSNDFAKDQLQADCLLSDSGTTHILSICQSSDSKLAVLNQSGLSHLHIELQDSKPSFEVLLQATTFVRGVMGLRNKAMSDSKEPPKRGSRFGHDAQVLVYSPSETTACLAVCATLLTLPPAPSFVQTSSTSLSLSLKCTPPTVDSVLAILQDTLPLFEPSSAFKAQLESFATAYRSRPPLPSPSLSRLDTNVTVSTSLNTQLPSPITPSSSPKRTSKHLPTPTSPTVKTTLSPSKKTHTKVVRSSPSSGSDVADNALKVMEGRFSSISIS